VRRASHASPHPLDPAGESNARTAAEGSRAPIGLPRGVFAVARYWIRRKPAPVTDCRAVRSLAWWMALLGQLEQFIHGTPGGAHACLCWCGRLWPHCGSSKTTTPSSTAMADWAGLAVVFDAIDAEVCSCNFSISVWFLKQHAAGYYDRYSMACARTATVGLDHFFLGGRRRHGDSRCDNRPSGCLALFCSDEARLSGMGAIRPPAFRQFMRSSRRALKQHRPAAAPPVT